MEERDARGISSIIFSGAREATLDAKGRMTISPPFSKILGRLNKTEVYVSKRKVTLSETSYPILQIKYELILPDRLTESERIKEYSAIRMRMDRQNRVQLPEWFVSHLLNGRAHLKKVTQSGGGDRVYAWYPEDFRDWESKNLEL